MAKQQLPTNFKDDVLAAQMVGKRRYRVTQNEDGTISLEDVTNYSQIGSEFGAAQMNATNMAVNESFDKNKVIDSLDDIAANESAGYAAGALAVRELNGKLKDTEWISVLSTTNVTVKYRVKNGFVTVVGQNSGNNSYKIPDGNYKSVTTIPEEYRPKFEIPFTFHLYGGSGTNLSGLIGTDGIIKLYQKGGSGNYWGFIFSYPV